MKCVGADHPKDATKGHCLRAVSPPSLYLSRLSYTTSLGASEEVSIFPASLLKSGRGRAATGAVALVSTGAVALVATTGVGEEAFLKTERNNDEHEEDDGDTGNGDAEARDSALRQRTEHDSVIGNSVSVYHARDGCYGNRRRLHMDVSHCQKQTHTYKRPLNISKSRCAAKRSEAERRDFWSVWPITIPPCIPNHNVLRYPLFTGKYCQH